MIRIEKEEPHSFRECQACDEINAETYKITISSPPGGWNGLRLCEVCALVLAQQLRWILEENE